MQLSREAIQRMFDNVGGGGAGGGGGSISPSILNSYASQAYVQENFVSIEFFNRLFKVHGASADILPNDTATTISHIEANYGLWTQSFLSAFGYNSSGGGGGGGDGSVTSVGLSMPTGFSVSGSPVTTSGTLSVSFASGYSLPSTAAQANWNTAYGWGDHSIAGYATQQWVTNQGYSTLSMTNVWAALESSSDSNRKINAVHLPDLSSTYLTTSSASSTYLTKTEAASTYLTSSSLSGYVTIGTSQTITADKTFSDAVGFNNNIYMGKTGSQQYINFSNGYTGAVGQGSDGSLYIYSPDAVSWYTSINSHIGLYQTSSGNVGVATSSPAYKLDVSGAIRTTDYIIIGNAKISYDSTNNALKVESVSGGTCHFYTTGGVAALGSISI